MGPRLDAGTALHHGQGRKDLCCGKLLVPSEVFVDSKSKAVVETAFPNGDYVAGRSCPGMGMELRLKSEFGAKHVPRQVR